MIHILRAFYGRQPTPPDDLFQFIVWEILSENALPARRDLAWTALKKIPALTPDAMFRAPANALRDAVALAGAQGDEKIDRLRRTVDLFKRHREVLHAEGLRRAGLRRGVQALAMVTTVDDDVRARAWLFSAGLPVLPIDREVSRVVNRLMGMVPTAQAPRAQTGPERRASRRRAARQWLVARLPRDLDSYRDAVVYLRHHAQHTCLPVAPHCTVCPLRVDCPAAAGASRD